MRSSPVARASRVRWPLRAAYTRVCRAAQGCPAHAVVSRSAEAADDVGVRRPQHPGSAAAAVVAAVVTVTAVVTVAAVVTAVVTVEAAAPPRLGVDDAAAVGAQGGRVGAVVPDVVAAVLEHPGPGVAADAGVDVDRAAAGEADVVEAVALALLVAQRPSTQVDRVAGGVGDPHPLAVHGAVVTGVGTRGV